MTKWWSRTRSKLLIENPLIPLAREHLNIEVLQGIGGLVDMKLIYVQTGPFDVTELFLSGGSNVGIGGDELVRGHYNKETKNCVRACYLYCLKSCIKYLEKEYRALCKV
ncbi:hypothetical protein AHAS_Ahas13G0209900 [Arachis hypogaea]